MNLSDYLNGELVCELTEDFDKNSVLEKLVSIVNSNGMINDPKEVYNALMEREKLGSTGVGDEVAIPHAKLESVEDIVILLAVSKNGINFDAVDKKPVKIFFLVLASAKKMNLHLKTLARISRLVKSTDFKDNILNAKNISEILEILKEEEAKL